MRQFAKSFFITMLFGAVGAFSAPVPLDWQHWNSNPLGWKIRADGITSEFSDGNFFAETKLPIAGEVQISATMRPVQSRSSEWSTAGVSIRLDSENYWHLALVQSPAAQGSRHFYELCENMDGKWLSQQPLRQTDNFEGKTWEFGRDYILSLRTDGKGITGEIKTVGGETVFRRSFEFTAPAVKTGRPGLHATSGFQAAFREIDAVAQKPADIPQKSIVPYQSDNFVKGIKGKATGFFRVEKTADGRWWTFDPKGRGMVLLGIDHVTFRGHWCETTQTHHHLEKNRKKYASKEVWEAETIERLKTWGFNMLGAGCDSALQHRGLVHTEFLSMGSILAYASEEYQIAPGEHRPCSAFPNVFHPDFEAICDWIANEKCAPCKNDPWLFGYFIDNELAWWGRGGSGTGLFDLTIDKPAGHTAKIALRDFLRQRCNGDLAAFNKLWGTELSGWDELLNLKKLPHRNDTQIEAKTEFLRLCAERYFSVAAAAIRKHDPNHLVLGARFAGTGGAHPAVWEVSGKYCDVTTFNCYPWADLDRNVMFMDRKPNAEKVTDHFAKYYNYVQRPIIITEWSFPALDSGLPCRNGAGQRFRTQTERTAATELCAKTMLSLPFIIGYDYFMWVDEPALGISKAFPEDSNYGLVNEDCEPYPEITKMFTGLHQDVKRWRFSPPPPANEVQPASTTLPQDWLAHFKPPAGIAPVKFFREDDLFRVAGFSGLTLSGRIGGQRMAENIVWHNKPYGSYNAMVQLGKNGNRTWIDADRVKDVQFRSESSRAVLEITSSYKKDTVEFELSHRLTVLPDRPQFLCELIGLKNTGKTPLNVEAFYFRLYPPFKETPGKQVPNLWQDLPKGCWIDKGNDRYIGFAAPINSSGSVYFWTDGPENGNLHPDAQFAVPKNTVVEPGLTFTPDTPMYFMAIIGEGGEANWQKDVEAISKLK
ncbi:MAG: hypothetical protein IJU44_00520 [Kiritimatiellae bacterium]|nr:hypothetical protein [Kiritimatiellia bacterium]